MREYLNNFYRRPIIYCKTRTVKHKFRDRGKRMQGMVYINLNTEKGKKLKRDERMKISGKNLNYLSCIKHIQIENNNQNVTQVEKLVEENESRTNKESIIQKFKLQNDKIQTDRNSESLKDARLINLDNNYFMNIYFRW